MKEYTEEPIGVVLRRGFGGSLLVLVTETNQKVHLWEGRGPGKVRTVDGDFGLTYVYANPRS